MGRRFAQVECPGAATAVTPRHPLRSGAVDSSTTPLLRLATQPARGREVVLPGRGPRSPPSGRGQPDTTKLPINGLGWALKAGSLTLMVALSLAVLSIMLGAPRELWLGPPF